MCGFLFPFWTKTAEVMILSNYIDLYEHTDGYPPLKHKRHEEGKHFKINLLVIFK